MTKKQPWGERFISAHTSHIAAHCWGKSGQGLEAGTWRQELRQRPWRKLLTGLLALFVQFTTTCLGMALPTVDWALRCHINHRSRKCPLRHVYRPILEAFSTLRYPLLQGSGRAAFNPRWISKFEGNLVYRVSTPSLFPDVSH